MSRFVSIVTLFLALFFTVSAMALPKNAQPSFIYHSGGKAVVRELQLKEALPRKTGGKTKTWYARHWKVENNKAVKWRGNHGERMLVLPVLDERQLPEDIWRSKLLASRNFSELLTSVNTNLSGEGKFGNPLGIEANEDGVLIMTAYGYGDTVYDDLQKISDALEEQTRRDLASPFRAVYSGYDKWRLSKDGKSGAQVLVPDYYNIALLADIFSGIHVNLTTNFKSQARAASLSFEEYLVDFVQSLYTRNTGANRANSLVTPEQVLANMAGNGDSKALLWLSIARGYGSPLLDRNLVLILRPNGALIGREIYDGEPGTGSHITLEGKNYRLISLESPLYAPAGVISLDEYRDLVNARWKYQVLLAPE